MSVGFVLIGRPLHERGRLVGSGDAEAQRYVDQANMMRLADNAAEKLISGTKIVSAIDPLSQIGEKHQ